MHSKDPKREARDGDLGALANLPSVVASEFVGWVQPGFPASSTQGTGPVAGGSSLSEAESRYLKPLSPPPGKHRTSMRRWRASARVRRLKSENIWWIWAISTSTS